MPLNKLLSSIRRSSARRRTDRAINPLGRCKLPTTTSREHSTVATYCVREFQGASQPERGLAENVVAGSLQGSTKGRQMTNRDPYTRDVSPRDPSVTDRDDLYARNAQAARPGGWGSGSWAVVVVLILIAIGMAYAFTGPWGTTGNGMNANNPAPATTGQSTNPPANAGNNASTGMLKGGNGSPAGNATGGNPPAGNAPAPANPAPKQ